MRACALLLVSALVLAAQADGDVYAILIGGSDGWYGPTRDSRAP